MRFIGLLAVVGACGGNSAAIDAPTTATAMQACMHICTCEANAPGTPGTTDTSCQTDCQQSQGPFGSTSTSMSTSTLGTSFSTTAGGVDFAASEQACVNCFANAACSAIVAGTVCADQCH